MEALEIKDTIRMNTVSTFVHFELESTLVSDSTHAQMDGDSIQQVRVACDDNFNEQGILVIGEQVLHVTKILSCRADTTVPLEAIILQRQSADTDSLHGNDSMLTGELAVAHHTTEYDRDFALTDENTQGRLGAVVLETGVAGIVNRSDIAAVSQLEDTPASSVNSDAKGTCRILPKSEMGDLPSTKKQRRGSVLGPSNSSSSGNKQIFQCDLCSASFNRQGNYNRHRMIHAIRLKDDYRYKCVACGKQFVQKCDLARHATIHTGTEPHRCEICNRGYIRASDLRVHMRFHLKQRTFKCQHCDKAFVQSGDLNRHVRSVHMKTKMLGCGHCLKKFAKEVTLRRHMQTAHWEIILKSIDGKEASREPNGMAK